MDLRVQENPFRPHLPAAHLHNFALMHCDFFGFINQSDYIMMISGYSEKTVFVSVSENKSKKR
jgi:hypothetical protein